MQGLKSLFAIISNTSPYLTNILVKVGHKWSFLV